MNKYDKTPDMPVVNLMDQSVEPTEGELKTMMVDVQVRATRKWQRVRAEYWDDIYAGIRALR